MKNNYPSLFAIAFMFSSSLLFAHTDLVCSISSFTANYVQSSCQGEIIEIEFDFIATDFGANGFTVETQNLSPQFFNLGDNFVIWEISNCDEEITLTIKDQNDPNCSASVIIGAACCDCEIDFSIIEPSVCQNGLFDAVIVFEPINGSCISYDWSATVEGITYPVQYDSNTNTWEVLGIDAMNSYTVFLELCSTGPPFDCFSYSFDNPCYSLPCEIIDFSAEMDTSLCIGEIIGISFDIVAQGFGLYGFIVTDGIGDQYYNLGDDYTFYTTSDCAQDVILSIYDEIDPNCYADVTVPAMCCDCDVTDLSGSTTVCQNGEFDLIVDLTIDSGSCLWYDWFVTIEGTNYDLEYFGNSFIAENIVANDSLINALVCSSAPTGECYNLEVLNPCFVSTSVCQITSFIADYDPLSCEGEILNINFDFNGSDFGLNGFTVIVNQVDYDFDLIDDYVISVISECSDSLTLTITDNDDPTCTLSLTMAPACCPCVIADPFVNPTACENGTFDIFVDLFVDSGSCINYDWFATVEGTDYDLTWNGSSLVAENIIAQDSLITISICTFSPTGECFDFIIENPCYLTTINCNINSFSASYIDSSCMGEIIMVDFQFDAMDFGLEGFTVNTGSTSSGFNLGDDYVVYALSDCTDSLVLTIIDNIDPNCTATVTLAPACCPCDITDPVVNPTACDNGSFDIFVDLFTNSGSCINYDWFATVEGTDYDLIWNGSSLVAENITASDSLVTVSLCTLSPTGECFDVIIVNPCFVSPSNCSIQSFTANYVQNSCQGEIIEIEFDFNATDFGADGFTVQTNNLSPQFFNLGDNYIIWEISDCSQSITLILTDENDSNCTATVTLDPACCPCDIEDPVVNPTACDNGTFDIFVDLFVNSGSCVNYDWFATVEGTDYDLIWNGSSLVAENISATDSLITISLCTLSPTGECFNVVIVNPCFVPPSNCTIDFFIAAYDDTSCFGELIDIIFDVTASDFGQSGFTISDGTSSQTYQLNSPYYFSTIADCSDSLALTITDNLDANCSSTLLLEPACCPCVISDISITTTDCIDDTFDIFIDPIFSSGSCINDDWTLTVEGQIYPLFFTGNSFLVSDVSATDSLVTITLCTLSPTGECFDYQIVNPCFVTTTTIVLSFTAQINEADCDDDGNAKVIFNYDVQNPGTLGFSISADGTLLGSYVYDEYLELQVPPNCGNQTTFEFQDLEFSSGNANYDLDVCCQTSSTENVLKQQVLVSRDGLNQYILQNLSTNKVSFTLYSLNGINYRSDVVEAASAKKLNLNDAPNGMYILKILDDQGYGFLKKLIKI